MSTGSIIVILERQDRTPKHFRNTLKLTVVSLHPAPSDSRQPWLPRTKLPQFCSNMWINLGKSGINTDKYEYEATLNLCLVTWEAENRGVCVYIYIYTYLIYNIYDIWCMYNCLILCIYTYMNMKQSIIQKMQPYQRKLEAAPPSRKAGFFCQSCYSSRCWIKGTWDYLGRRWEQHYHPTQKKWRKRTGILEIQTTLYIASNCSYCTFWEETFILKDN